MVVFNIYAVSPLKNIGEKWGSDLSQKSCLKPLQCDLLSQRHHSQSSTKPSNQAPCALDDARATKNLPKPHLPTSQVFFRGIKSSVTPWKFNSSPPEKWWLEDYFPIGMVHFQGRPVKLRGGIWSSTTLLCQQHLPFPKMMDGSSIQAKHLMILKAMNDGVLPAGLAKPGYHGIPPSESFDLTELTDDSPPVVIPSLASCFQKWQISHSIHVWYISLQFTIKIHHPCR